MESKSGSHSDNFINERLGPQRRVDEIVTSGSSLVYSSGIDEIVTVGPTLSSAASNNTTVRTTKKNIVGGFAQTAAAR